MRSSLTTKLVFFTVKQITADIFQQLIRIKSRFWNAGGSHATICQYVQPKYGVLDHFISQMTGITNDRWTDYQKTFDNRYDFDRSVGLADALELCEIEPDGHFHDGLDDAINTAKIIKKLEEKDLGENAVWIRNF